VTDPKYPDIFVRLSGEDGNAFSIIARVRKALREAGIPASEIDVFTQEAQSGDYNNMIQTCMRWVEVE
jgi:hypothetical protein